MKRSSVSSSVESANRSSNGEVTNNINADQGGSATGGNTINKNKSNNTTKHRATTNKIFSGGNTRLRRRQKRSGMYRKQQAVKALQKKVVNYDLGAAELATSLMPTNEEITRAVDKEYNASKKGALADKFRSSASKIAAAQKKASKIIEAMLKDWDKGGHGFVPHIKPDGIIRIIWENWNSLKYFTEKDHNRIRTIEEIRKHWNADLVGGCELMVDWSQADDDFFDLFGMGEERRGAAAYNKKESNERAQPGGTSLMAFGQISPYVTKVTPDSTGLGRWVTLTLSSGSKVVNVVMAYRPCFPSSIRRRGKDRLGSTVWEQQDRYFRARGEFRDPLEMFDTQLLELMRGWRSDDEEIILMGDFNTHVYESHLATQLRKDDICLQEQFQKLFDSDAPYQQMSKLGSIKLYQPSTGP